jgi:NAD(P)-dependent dehydrogenase (short-subunit alcohol dehydrogenase family)
MSDKFHGKVALVTGASSGIGRATALAFAANGAAVVIADVNEQDGQAAANEIADSGGRSIFVATDVSKRAEVEELVSQTVSAYGGLDFAFNNAGIEGEMASTVDCTEEDWDRVLGINLKGIWLCMRAEIPVMLERGGGSIVNCASVAGLVGFTNACAYSASKHGVVGLTKTTALEYSTSGIRVNAVCPGVIDTPMIQRYVHIHPEAEGALASGEPVGRLGQPEEIANAVVWLSSAKASFVTGHAMAVDGGWVAQ